MVEGGNIMKREEIKDYLENHLEVRPFNEEGKEDGKRNYIHRLKVIDLLFELKAVPAE